MGTSQSFTTFLFTSPYPLILKSGSLFSVTTRFLTSYNFFQTLGFCVLFAWSLFAWSLWIAFCIPGGFFNFPAFWCSLCCHLLGIRHQIICPLYGKLLKEMNKQKQPPPKKSKPHNITSWAWWPGLLSQPARRRGQEDCRLGVLPGLQSEFRLAWETYWDLVTKLETTKTLFNDGIC